LTRIAGEPLRRERSHFDFGPYAQHERLRDAAALEQGSEDVTDTAPRIAR